MDKFRLDRRDVEMLTSIADYQVLSAIQIAKLHKRCVERVRGRLGRLKAQGIVQATTRGFGQSRGRPERFFALTPAGANELKARGVLKPDAMIDQVLAPDVHTLNHHLLLNEFRVHLMCIPSFCSSLHVRSCSSTTGLLKYEGLAIAAIEEQFGTEAEDGGPVRFVPDGVFAITHKPTARTVQFYLEVDMGTETLASPRRLGQDVRTKILNYQACFAGNHYKRYEQIWACKLRGFRLLFLTNDSGRATDLCRLVREMPPSDFVWVTDHVSIMDKGAWGPIWIPGGQLNVARRSILGSCLPNPCPSPSIIAPQKATS